MCCIVIYIIIQHYNDTTSKTDAWINDARTIKMQEGRRKKTSLEKYSPLTLLQGFERVVEGLHVRGCWRPNINFIFWPHCYDRHVVSFLFSCCWGLLHRGFSEGPLGRVWPSLLHLVSIVWKSAGNCFCTPNSTELNNNSTPTRSPTGSLNGMFNRHQAEITVMQLRLLSSGASL